MPAPFFRTWIKNGGGRLLVLFFLWMLLSGGYIAAIELSGGNVIDSDPGHYNELAQSFRHGQLALMVPIDPVLLNAPDPYDPQYTNGHFIWDLSYYKGHYYLYFGAAPCVLLYYPYLLLTGKDLNECLAFFIICSVNLLVFGLLLDAFVRLRLTACPIRWVALLFVAYGVASPMTYQLALIDMYETAAVSGSTAILLCLYALFCGLHSPRHSVRWFLLASLGWGLAVGSRPGYLFAGPVLGLTWLHLLHQHYRALPGQRTRFLANTLALALPALPVLGLIGWYNAARFGSPFEFGLKYITANVDTGRPYFSCQYILNRLWQYLIMPPHFDERFPFINPYITILPWIESYQVAWEHMTGIFVSFPLLLIGLLWIRNTQRFQPATTRPALLAYGMAVTAAALGPFLVLILFNHTSYRYLSDFVPTLYVLAAFSFLIRRHQGPFSRWETAVVLLMGLITIYAGFAYIFVGDANRIWVYYNQKDGWPEPN